MNRILRIRKKQNRLETNQIQINAGAQISRKKSHKKEKHISYMDILIFHENVVSLF